MSNKSLFWIASSKAAVRAFPASARRRTGFQLRRVQQGLDPDDWKPMKTVGPGVREIRIHTEREHRVLYIARFNQGVYVLHGFEKKTGRTPKADLGLAKRRFRALLEYRRSRYDAES